MGLEHLKEIQDAFIFCGAEGTDICENTRVADVLADSVGMIQLFERLGIPLNHYLTNGMLNDEGKFRIKTIGELNEDGRRAEELIKSEDLYGVVTALDIDRVIGYENIASIK